MCLFILVPVGGGRLPLPSKPSRSTDRCWPVSPPPPATATQLDPTILPHQIIFIDIAKSTYQEMSEVFHF
jgi:hypothetical protein